MKINFIPRKNGCHTLSSIGGAIVLVMQFLKLLKFGNFDFKA